MLRCVAGLVLEWGSLLEDRTTRFLDIENQTLMSSEPSW